MIDTTMYAANFEEAKKMMETSAKEISPEFFADEGNMKVIYTSLVMSAIDKFGLFERKILEELTGLELETNEKLYDYLASVLKFNRDKAMEYSFALIVQNGDVDILMKAIKDGGV